MFYNGNKVQDLYYNGNKVQQAWMNGVQVWPTNEILSYRVYIEWDPTKDDNICIDGMTWNGSAMTTAMFELSPGSTTTLDVSYNNGGTWTTMSNSDVEKMIAGNTESLQRYCRGISFRMKKDWGFNQFTWTSDQYYAPTGYMTVEVYENGSEQSNIVATKTVNQNSNTTYTVNRGDS